MNHMDLQLTTPCHGAPYEAILGDPETTDNPDAIVEYGCRFENCVNAWSPTGQLLRGKYGPFDHNWDEPDCTVIPRPIRSGALDRLPVGAVVLGSDIDGKTVMQKHKDGWAIAGALGTFETTRALQLKFDIATLTLTLLHLR